MGVNKLCIPSFCTESRQWLQTRLASLEVKKAQTDLNLRQDAKNPAPTSLETFVGKWIHLVGICLETTPQRRVCGYMPVAFE